MPWDRPRVPRDVIFFDFFVFLGGPGPYFLKIFCRFQCVVWCGVVWCWCGVVEARWRCWPKALGSGPSLSDVAVSKPLQNTPELESLDSPPSAWPHQRRHRDQHQPFIFRCFFLTCFFYVQFCQICPPRCLLVLHFGQKVRQSTPKGVQNDSKKSSKTDFF